jgi:two-component system, sensor histidine kinase LadS
MSSRFARLSILLAVAILFQALSCVAASPPLFIDHRLSSIPLGGHLDFLEDKAGTLTIDQVITPEVGVLFRPDHRDVINFGRTNSVVWLRFTVQAGGEQPVSRLLELGFPQMDFIDLYIPRREGGFEVLQAGDMRPMSIRSFRHAYPVFPLLLYGTPQTIYLRADARGLALFPLTLWEEQAFFRIEYRRSQATGLYFGAMAAMIVFHLFIFISLREKLYLFYILNVASAVLQVLFARGFLIEVFAEAPQLNAYAFVLLIPALLTGALFTRYFLDTRRCAPRLDRLLLGYILVIGLVLPVLVFAAPLAARGLWSLASLLGPVLSLSAGIVCLRGGFSPARYLVGAGVFRLVGSLGTAFAVNNLTSNLLFIRYGVLVGSLLDAILFAFALADRFNRLRKEREEAREEALRARHLASLGELAAEVAHEINTPVNTIINSAELILEGEDRASLEHDVGVIQKEGRRIAEITTSLLSYARRANLVKSPCAVTDLLHGTLVLLGGSLRKENIEVIQQIPADLPNVLVNPQQIEQVFLNVVKNAIAALTAKHNGTMHVKRLEIVASAMLLDNRLQVRIAFQDNGIGLTPEDLAMVGEPFFTTKREGTGLGLNISRRILDEHGGALEIESRPGECTTVNIDLRGRPLPKLLPGFSSAPARWRPIMPGS